MCGCGCNTCETGVTVTLNKRLINKENLSEGMRYHLDKKQHLSNTLYEKGSEEYFRLFYEARYLYSRSKINLSGEDLKIILETNLGHYGSFKGIPVPLDYPRNGRVYIEGLKSKHLYPNLEVINLRVL